MEWSAKFYSDEKHRANSNGKYYAPQSVTREINVLLNK